MNILPASSYDGSTASLVGEKYKGDGYYGRADGLHTVAWSLSGYTGSIGMQGTLAADPGEDDWFNITLDTVALTDVDYVAASTNAIYNFTGNYVWVRVALTNWTAGTVNAVYLNR